MSKPMVDLPKPYAIECGARFDESGTVLMELIVEPTSQDWTCSEKRYLYTEDQLRGYAKAVAKQADAADRPEYPECTGTPFSCPENEGYGCCKTSQPDSFADCFEDVRELLVRNLEMADRIHEQAKLDSYGFSEFRDYLTAKSLLERFDGLVSSVSRIGGAA